MKQHLNIPQLKAAAINPRELYVVAGRATGKTQGILAPHTFFAMNKMPRSCGLGFGNSYRKMMTDLLPPLILGWEKLGWFQDIDYTIGTSDIPKKKKWQDPYIAPEKRFRQFFLHAKTGAGIRFASQDRRVTLNGTEVDYIFGDEAKLLDYNRFRKEILPTNRGRVNLFGHLPEHHSIWFLTDKLFDRKGGDWIMKMKQRQDDRLIDLILQTQCLLTKLQEEHTPSTAIDNIKKQLLQAQCEAVAFIEASTLDNIHALGWDFIRQQEMNLTNREFRVAILNETIGSLEGGFYATFDRVKHTYSSATNYEKLDELNFDLNKIKNLDCTFDLDLDRTEPLIISVDWGGSINSMVVCQENKIEIKVLKNLFTKPPQTYKELARQFCNYYAPMINRKIEMYYDPSGNNARADSNETYAEEFSSILRDKGFNVIQMNIGETNPHYEKKKLLFEILLAQEDNRLPMLKINSEAAPELVTSIENAAVKIGKRGFEKDKSSEDVRSGVLPEYATHLSDALDIIIFSKYSYILSGRIRLSDGAM